MNSYTIIVLIFGILTFLVLFLLFFLNRLFFFQRKVLNYYDTVSNYLEERITLVKDEISFIKKNLDYEDVYIKKLETTIESLTAAKTVNEHLEQLKKTKKTIMKFLELENTYSFLKDNKEYIRLKEELSLNEERIDYALEGYNKGVHNYHQYQENRFIHFISKVFRFPDYDNYNK